MQFPKVRRVEDDEFLERLRNEPCVTCGAPPRSDPSHLKTIGAGGSDYTACSQCRRCHQLFHRLGPIQFVGHTRSNPWQGQSRQVVAYLTDPVVTLRRAADLVANRDVEMTPVMVLELRRLLKLLELRAEVE